MSVDALFPMDTIELDGLLVCGLISHLPVVWLVRSSLPRLLNVVDEARG